MRRQRRIAIVLITKLEKNEQPRVQQLRGFKFWYPPNDVLAVRAGVINFLMTEFRVNSTVEDSFFLLQKQ
jgi:hypothetical protein